MEWMDQMGRKIVLSSPPKRIISLVPSQTELLFDLGLEEEVVGITKFCIHPESWFRSKTRVGGTKNVSLEKVKTLKPDLIIGNKEENSKEDIEVLSQHFPVWMSDIFDLKDSLSMIQSIGQITGKEESSLAICNKIRSEFANFPKNIPNKKVLYFIWQKPNLVAGKNTFIDSLITQMGWTNVAKKERYPEAEVEEINEADFIWLSSEPFPFKEKHVLDWQTRFPEKTIQIVDGEYFSWYGSRLQEAPSYFKTLIV